jgi:hypothetical protein
MKINHECLKAILHIFMESEKASLPLDYVAEHESICEAFNQEQIIFHLQRMFDCQWLITSSKYTDLFYRETRDSPAKFEPIDCRTTDAADQYYDAAMRSKTWDAIKAFAPISLELCTEAAKILLSKMATDYL